MDLDVIDPNETVPEGDRTGKYVNPPRETTIVNPFDHLKKPGKHGTKTSSEGQENPRKRKNIFDLQNGEFLWAFLEGTETVPQYDDIDWELKRLLQL